MSDPTEAQRNAALQLLMADDALVPQEAPAAEVPTPLLEGSENAPRLDAPATTAAEPPPPAEEKSPEQVRADILASIQARRAARQSAAGKVDPNATEAERLRAELEQVRRDRMKDAEIAELLKNGQARRALELAGKDINKFTAELVDEAAAASAQQQEVLLARLQKLEQERAEERLAVERQRAQQIAYQQRLLAIQESKYLEQPDLAFTRALYDQPERFAQFIDQHAAGEPLDAADILDYARLVEQSTREEVSKLMKAGALDAMLAKAGWSKAVPAPTAPKAPIPNGANRTGTAADTKVSYEESKRRALEWLGGS